MKYCKNGDVRFNLKKKKVNGEPFTRNLQIWMTYNFDGKRLRYYTGKRIDLNKWDESGQKVKSRYEGATIINDFLKNMARFVEDKHTKQKINGKNVTVEYLRDELNKRDQKSTSDFFSLFDHFIEISKPGRSPLTIKKYNNVKNHLKNFEKERRFKIDFDSIDHNFYEKFNDYLIRDVKLTNNTISKIIKGLKTFLNYAFETGKNKNIEFKKFKVNQNKPKINVLSWDELMKIYKGELKDKKLYKVRDMFCFACFTGLRFSDVQNLKPENVKNDSIHITTIKNKKDLSIPLTNYSKEILSHYLDEEKAFIFPRISNQKMNDYIKDVGKELEINEKVQIIRFRGGERIQETFEKHEIMTSHMARKTFITLALRLGMPSEVIMEISGHSDHKVFERYYEIAEEQKKAEMLKAFK